MYKLYLPFVSKNTPIVYNLFLPFVARNDPPIEDPTHEVLDIRDSLYWHPSKTYSVRPYSWIKGIAVHHTVRSSNPWNVSYYHVYNLNWPGIGYHYYIMPGGTIYKTNLHTTISFHVGDPNWNAIGIVLDGDFRYKHPTAEQLCAGKWLINQLYNDPDFGHQLEHVEGHVDYPGVQWYTACPGYTYPEWLPDMKQPY